MISVLVISLSANISFGQDSHIWLKCKQLNSDKTFAIGQGVAGLDFIVSNKDGSIFLGGPTVLTCNLSNETGYILKCIQHGSKTKFFLTRGVSGFDFYGIKEDGTYDSVINLTALIQCDFNL